MEERAEMRHPITTPAAAVALVILIGPSTAFAQAETRDDVTRLAGTWNLDVERSDRGPAERRVVRIATDVLRVEVQRPSDESPLVLIYKLDGSESINQLGHGTAKTRLRREGQDIVTEAVLTVSNTPVTVNERLRVNADGTELIVETILRVEHGYQGVRHPLSSQAPNVGKGVSVFVKE